MPWAPKPISNRLNLGSQLLAFVLSFSLCSSAVAEPAGGSPGTGTTGGAGPLLSQAGAPIERAPTSTILPTDVVPLPAAQERTSFGENLQLRVLQKLPAPFYFTVNYEMSDRYETNIFQFPTKRKFLTQLPNPQQFARLNAFAQGQLLNTLNEASAHDTVLRLLPNITWGWALKPRTRIYGNWFMIRDQLSHWIQLNTIIYSLAYGIQQDIPVARRGNLQLDTQFRELWQLHQKPVFDFLPGATFSYILTPRAVLFVNALAQLRGLGYFRSPNREMDPFYTWGGFYSKGGWSFSASSTFVQNFRQPFHHAAAIPVNNYSIISDFEIARRVIRQLPGLQVFARAEPIWNFHSHSRPGLTGMDFRMYFGGRFQFGKPALTAALEQIKQQLEEQETAPTAPGKPPGEAKPSAFIMPYQVVTDNPQPIHGYLPGLTGQSVSDAGGPDNLAILPVARNRAALASASQLNVDGPAPPAIPAPQANIEPAPAPAEARSPAPQTKPLLGGLQTELTSTASPVSTGIKESLTPAAKPEDDPKMIVVLPPGESPVIRDEKSSAESGQSIAQKLESTDNTSQDEQAKTKRHKKRNRRSKKEATSAAAQDRQSRAAASNKPNGEIRMVVVPPLPTIKPESKENPFENSGVDLKPPILINPIR